MSTASVAAHMRHVADVRDMRYGGVMTRPPRTTSGSLEPAVWRSLRAMKLAHTTPDSAPTLSAVVSACVAVAENHPNELADAMKEPRS